jgi:hypothetical protein
MSKEICIVYNYMDRIYQAARLQLPIVYEIIDRISTMFVSRYNVVTIPLNEGCPYGATYTEKIYDNNSRYNLRPRKPVSYKV